MQRALRRGVSARRENGTAAVEFALVLPLLIFLVFGLIQFGWYFFVSNSASGAAREAARRIVVGDCWTGSTPSLTAFVTAQAPTTTSVTYSPADLSAQSVGDMVTVTVKANASLINFLPLPTSVTREFKARLEDQTATPGGCS